MKATFGLKAHSGWAALVALGGRGRQVELIDRRRLELVEADQTSWAKQPYHAAESLPASQARSLVGRGIESARRIAARELLAAVRRARDAGHEVTACAVLKGAPMPGWSVEEILAVHFRMHKAEGVLFQDALARAAGKAGLSLVEIPGKLLMERAERSLAAPWNSLLKGAAALGKTAGPPWGKDQKEAALAAMIALRERG